MPRREKKAPGNGMKLLEQLFFLLVIVFKNFLLVICTELCILKEKYDRFCLEVQTIFREKTLRGFLFLLALTTSFQNFFHSQYFNQIIILFNPRRTFKYSHKYMCECM